MSYQVRDRIAPLTDPTNGTSEPDRYWAVTNISEAVSHVLSPMCWSLWRSGMFRARTAGYGALGLMPASLPVPGDQNELSNAIFFGQLAVNVDLNRAMWASLPGMTDEAFERSTTGTVRPGLTKTKKAYWRLPNILVRCLRTSLVHGRRTQELARAQRAWWQRAVEPANATDPSARVDDAVEHFVAAMAHHLRTRYLHVFWMGRLNRLAAGADGVEAASLIGGFGGVDEVRVADDLWKVAHGQLSQDAFLREHGYHGPHEGNVLTTSWRENPAPLRGLVAAYRSGPARPAARAQAARERHAAAVAALLAVLPWQRRSFARLVLGRVEALTVQSELGKASFIMAIDALRAGVRAAGEQAVSDGAIDQADDLFFFMIEELKQGIPANAREVVAHRRALREQHARATLPRVFVGIPTVTYADDTHPGEDGPAEVRGVGTSNGVIVGPVAVVRDVSEADKLVPGGVLVCRTTDPSWTPLLAIAGAVVTDIGSIISHGAIAARELGIPCVMGTGNGTRLLKDGQEVSVDGATGLVTIVTGSALGSEVAKS